MTRLGLLSISISGLISFRRACADSTRASPHFSGKTSLKSLEDGESEALCSWRQVEKDLELYLSSLSQRGVNGSWVLCPCKVKQGEELSHYSVEILAVKATIPHPRQQFTRKVLQRAPCSRCQCEQECWLSSFRLCSGEPSHCWQ